MSDFDELLEQVLRDEANVEPPAGMKGRLASAISLESSGRGGMGAFWRLAGAAAILIVFIGSQAIRYRREVTGPLVERINQRASLTAGTGKMSLNDFPPRLAPLPVRPTHSGHRDMRKVVNRIEPIVVARLVVRPIEIASLTSKNPDLKGETR